MGRILRRVARKGANLVGVVLGGLAILLVLWLLDLGGGDD
jgi:hypothetical protein